jgi:hypothetical protein
MDSRDGSVTEQFAQLKSRFVGADDSSDDTDSSDKPFWKRYGALFQLLAVAGAFGGIIASAASTALDRTMAVARESGPALLDTLWPILLGVTLVAVAVCLVVVALGMRNV